MKNVDRELANVILNEVIDRKTSVFFKDICMWDEYCLKNSNKNKVIKWLLQIWKQYFCAMSMCRNGPYDEG